VDSIHIEVDTSRVSGPAEPAGPQLQERNRSAPVLTPELEALFALARKARGGLDLETLCNGLDASPAAVRALLEQAKRVGMPLDVADGAKLMFRPPSPSDRVQTTEAIAPTVDAVRAGVISDLHYGSRFCLRDRIADTVDWLYAEGVRCILLPGDIHDGNYVGHGLFELSHVGFEAQLEDSVEHLPRREGLTYLAISGNHDETFLTQNGADIVAALAQHRPDVRYYGHRGAFLNLAGTVVHLWHPSGGGSYAVSYKLQKRIEAYASGEKPHVLLAGHWHRYCHIYERGVHAFCCPTFQGGGSAFGRSLASGAPAIGGMLLEWDRTADGTLRNFRHTYRAYFEVEKPAKV